MTELFAERGAMAYLTDLGFDWQCEDFGKFLAIKCSFLEYVLGGENVSGGGIHVMIAAIDVGVVVVHLSGGLVCCWFELRM